MSTASALGTSGLTPLIPIKIQYSLLAQSRLPLP